MAKVKTTFSLAKLGRKIDKTIVTGLNTMMNHLNKEIQEHLEAGKDIHGKPYESLSEVTQNMRDNKMGYYSKGGGGGTLNWSGNMRKTKKTPAVPGAVPTAKIEMVGKRKGQHYGAYHNEGASRKSGNLPQREWFGMTKSMKPGGKELNKALGIIKLGIVAGWKK